MMHHEHVGQIYARGIYERIRELCARTVKAEGVEFQIVVLELANAIDLWQVAKDKNDSGAAAHA